MVVGSGDGVAGKGLPHRAIVFTKSAHGHTHHTE
jgi:hypothetical protein